MINEFDQLWKLQNKVSALANDIYDLMYPKRKDPYVKVAAKPSFCEMGHGKFCVTFECSECGQAVGTTVEVK